MAVHLSLAARGASLPARAPSPRPPPPLPPAEYAFKAVKAPGLTSIGVRGDDCVVLLTQKRVPDKLVDATSVTRLFALSPSVGAVMTGPLPDARAAVSKARAMAGKFEFDHGYACPAGYLARLVADEAQVYTQAAYKRSNASVMILGAVDDEAGPQLYKVDPAGHFLGYKAAAAGAKEAEAANLLEKALKAAPPASLTPAETVRLALGVFQALLATDFRADEIEVAALVGKGGRFRVLPADEVEGHLTAMAEKD